MSFLIYCIYSHQRFEGVCGLHIINHSIRKNYEYLFMVKGFSAAKDLLAVLVGAA